MDPGALAGVGCRCVRPRRGHGAGRGSCPEGGRLGNGGGRPRGRPDDAVHVAPRPRRGAALARDAGVPHRAGERAARRNSGQRGRLYTLASGAWGRDRSIRPRRGVRRGRRRRIRPASRTRHRRARRGWPSLGLGWDAPAHAGAGRLRVGRTHNSILRRARGPPPERDPQCREPGRAGRRKRRARPGQDAGGAVRRGDRSRFGVLPARRGPARTGRVRLLSAVVRSRGGRSAPRHAVQRSHGAADAGWPQAGPDRTGDPVGLALGAGKHGATHRIRRSGRSLGRCVWHRRASHADARGPRCRAGAAVLAGHLLLSAPRAAVRLRRRSRARGGGRVAGGAQGAAAAAAPHPAPSDRSGHRNRRRAVDDVEVGAGDHAARHGAERGSVAELAGAADAGGRRIRPGRRAAGGAADAALGGLGRGSRRPAPGRGGHRHLAAHGGLAVVVRRAVDPRGGSGAVVTPPCAAARGGGLGCGRGGGAPHVGRYRARPPAAGRAGRSTTERRRPGGHRLPGPVQPDAGERPASAECSIALRGVAHLPPQRRRLPGGARHVVCGGRSHRGARAGRAGARTGLLRRAGRHRARGPRAAAAHPGARPGRALRERDTVPRRHRRYGRRRASLAAHPAGESGTVSQGRAPPRRSIRDVPDAAGHGRGGGRRTPPVAARRMAGEGHTGTGVAAGLATPARHRPAAGSLTAARQGHTVRLPGRDPARPAGYRRGGPQRRPRAAAGRPRRSSVQVVSGAAHAGARCVLRDSDPGVRGVVYRAAPGGHGAQPRPPDPAGTERRGRNCASVRGAVAGRGR